MGNIIKEQDKIKWFYYIWNWKELCYFKKK